MSLNSILEIERDRIRREKVVFDSLYERLTIRINNCVKMKAKDCIYKIPPLIIGYPLINQEKAMRYLLDKLQKSGFICLALSKEDLYVTWDPEKIKQLHLESKNTLSEEDNINLSRINDDFVTSLINEKRNTKI